MNATPLLDRCYKCGFARPIVKVESVVRYGKPVDLLSCAPCAGVKPLPEPKSATGYLTLQQITDLKTTPQGLVLDAIGQGVLSSLQINGSIALRTKSYLPRVRLTETLRGLVSCGALEAVDRLGNDKRYRLSAR
jgi:hypothetical protein